MHNKSRLDEPNILEPKNDIHFRMFIQLLYIKKFFVNYKINIFFVNDKIKIFFVNDNIKVLFVIYNIISFVNYNIKIFFVNDNIFKVLTKLNFYLRILYLNFKRHIKIYEKPCIFKNIKHKKCINDGVIIIKTRLPIFFNISFLF